LSAEIGGTLAFCATHVQLCLKAARKVSQSQQGHSMRTYLVVIDDSPEAALALHFAARRAAKTGGAVHIVSVVEPPAFVAWGGVQATMEEEVRQKAEAVVAAAAGRLAEDYAVTTLTTVKQGDSAQMVREVLADSSDIAALVLAAAATGSPGPLVEHFSGWDAGVLPVPLMIVPGSLTLEELDRLS
jgi:nucleotide-binding universal stress UspA family protein